MEEALLSEFWKAEFKDGDLVADFGASDLHVLVVESGSLVVYSREGEQSSAGDNADVGAVVGSEDVLHKRASAAQRQIKARAPRGRTLSRANTRYTYSWRQRIRPPHPTRRR